MGYVQEDTYGPDGPGNLERNDDNGVLRQDTGGRNAEEMIEAAYLGVDAIGNYDIKPHLGSGAGAFRGAMNGVFLDMHPDKS
jgi:restriction system protein